MTTNQIAFYKAKEEAKHWKRQDKLAKQQTKETLRHNVATEALTQQELGIKDWANKANVDLGFTNAAINRSHYERQDAINKEHYARQDAINQAHYERSDLINEKLGHIQNDKLVLDYISTLGTPITGYTLDSAGNKVEYSGQYIATEDYFSPNKAGVSFETTPISLQYLAPAAIGNYGRTISAVSTVISTVGKFFGAK